MKNACEAGVIGLVNCLVNRKPNFSGVK